MPMFYCKKTPLERAKDILKFSEVNNSCIDEALNKNPENALNIVEILLMLKDFGFLPEEEIATVEKNIPWLNEIKTVLETFDENSGKVYWPIIKNYPQYATSAALIICSLNITDASHKKNNTEKLIKNGEYLKDIYAAILMMNKYKKEVAQDDFDIIVNNARYMKGLLTALDIFKNSNDFPDIVNILIKQPQHTSWVIGFIKEKKMPDPSLEEFKTLLNRAAGLNNYSDTLTKKCLSVLWENTRFIPKDKGFAPADLEECLPHLIFDT
jgi:hypothetical protein